MQVWSGSCTKQRSKPFPSCRTSASRLHGEEISALNTKLRKLPELDHFAPFATDGQPS